MSGVNYDGDKIRKAAVDAIKDYIVKTGGVYSQECNKVVVKISNQVGIPLVCRNYTRR